MRPSIEKELIKKEVLLSKEDILKKIKHLEEDTSLTGQEIDRISNLRDKLENTTIPRISLNLDNEKVDTYHIDLLDGSLYRGRLTEFFFEYDNNEHELYLSSFCTETEDDPII